MESVIKQVTPSYFVVKLWKSTKLLFCGLGLVLLAAGCGSTEDSESSPTPDIPHTPTPTQTARPTQTNTPSITPTSTNTPSPTPTNTPTPTPTPTTEPVIIFGDPVADLRESPQGTFRTSCGEVDLLDFPMDPPNASQYNRGGRDFGVFRARYDKYHAGEDWWKSGGVLGEPVHSIGHGRITYAQPNGWGRDKGVIIIEHVFTDGRKILSFYGHLDEDSFEVSFGQCVERGQLLAKVGRPRTPPHLHFEMRSQAPDQTLGGYWDIDPRTAGWVWPSMRIWEERIRAQDGVDWVRSLEATGIRYLGQLPSGRIAILEENKLISIDTETGLERRFLNFIEEPTNGAVSENQLFVPQKNDKGLIFNFNSSGFLDPTVAGEFPAQPNKNVMIPRPGGGVVIGVEDGLIGINREGNQLWRVETDGEIIDQLADNSTVYLSISGQSNSMWRIPLNGIPVQIGEIGGQFAKVEEQFWVLDEQGLHQLLEDGSTYTVQSLPGTNTTLSNLQLLENGNLLLAHADNNDRRLFLYSPQGMPVWERSFRELGRGRSFLHEIDGIPYLLFETSSSGSGGISIYQINFAAQQLERIFESGTRFSFPVDTWIEQVNQSNLMINVGGGPIVYLNPAQAATP